MNSYSIYSEVAIRNGILNHYPGFTEWINRISSDKDHDIISIYHQDTMIAGCILKYSEYKICSILVDAQYRYNCYGTSLFKYSMKALHTTNPFITIPESLAAVYKPLFSRFGFVNTSTHYGLYVPNQNELFFNEQHE